MQKSTHSTVEKKIAGYEPNTCRYEPVSRWGCIGVALQPVTDFAATEGAAYGTAFVTFVCVCVFNMYVNKVVDENSVSSSETEGLFLCYNHGSALQVMFGCVSGLLCCVDERYSLIGNRANDS